MISQLKRAVTLGTVAYETRRIAVNIAKLPNAARTKGPSRQSEPADKPSVVLNRWSCPKSIFVLRRGATLLAIVLLGHRR
jgi:hypothetical protein